MKKAAVANAVKSRWNAAGLASSICALYAGNVGITGKSAVGGASSPTGARAVGGAPPGTTLPRAEYLLDIDKEDKRSKGSRIVCQPVRFQVWGRSFETVTGYVDEINEAFVNCEASMTITDCTVVGVNDGGGGVFKQDDEIYQGVQTIEIEYRFANAAAP